MAANYNPQDEISKSLFNEAGFIIRRLDILQSQIHSMRRNPLAWNKDIGEYNYKIWFSDLCSLLNEVWSKLSDEEKKHIDNVREIIHKALKVMPPHKMMYRPSTNSNEVMIKNSNWNLIEGAIISFEKNIKEYLDNHGMGNPDIEGDLF